MSDIWELADYDLVLSDGSYYSGSSDGLVAAGGVWSAGDLIVFYEGVPIGSIVLRGDDGSWTAKPHNEFTVDGFASQLYACQYLHDRASLIGAILDQPAAQAHKAAYRQRTRERKRRGR